jgi:hypothetical protein
MDVVDDRGHAFILYAASLKWKAIQLGYKGSIEYASNGRSRTEGEFMKNSSLPVVDNQQLTWTSNGHSFNWKSVDGAVSERLLESVHWNCIQPKAKCEISKDGSLISRGFGYTERLELKIAPWNLPIHELLWGRYLSENNTITWICWRGPEPRSIVYHNGVRITDAIITAEKLTWDSYKLTLPCHVMRNDTIGQSVFGKFRNIMKLFPRKIMGLEEIKLCGSAELTDDNSVVDVGSVIHEVVTWS